MPSSEVDFAGMEEETREGEEKGRIQVALENRCVWCLAAPSVATNGKCEKCRNEPELWILPVVVVQGYREDNG